VFLGDGECQGVKGIKKQKYPGGVLAEETVFVYSSGKLVAEYSNQPSQTPTVAYTTTDHLGSPRMITDKYGQVKSAATSCRSARTSSETSGPAPRR
jgi:hypothetical protein